jgi:hypothetical protein
VPKKSDLHNQNRNQTFTEHQFSFGESQKRGEWGKDVMSVTTILRLKEIIIVPLSNVENSKPAVFEFLDF